MSKVTNIISIRLQKLILRTPDFREERGDLVLLIWGDIPYWTIVDKDFESLLNQLNGENSLQDIIKKNPTWNMQKKEIITQLKIIRNAGVFSNKLTPYPKQPLYGTKIENVAINITQQCNLRCKFCYNLPYLTSGNKDEITDVEINCFLQKIKPFVGKNPIITILGGEPLMDIDKLISVSEQAIRQKFTVLVSTNGIKITDDFARNAAKLGIQIQVSLDGHNAVLHDSIRGKGSFEGAVEGVRTLVRNHVHTIISMVCHQGNIDFLKDFFMFVKKMSVNEARFIPLKCMGGAVNSDYKPVPLNELLNNAFILFKKYPEFLSLTRRDAFSIQANTCKYSLRRASCGTGLQTILLDADGSLYPCLNTNSPIFRIANIRDINFNFQEIWLKSQVLSDVRKQSILFESEQEHANCPVRYWCLGGCRGENHALTGDLAKLPPHCNELKRSIVDMFWMIAEHPDIRKESVKIC